SGYHLRRLHSRLPTDTAESIARDIEIIKKELPIDILEFFCLTPLPGSEDHKKLHAAGVDLDPDLNKYDLEHACTDHPRMPRQRRTEVYEDAFARYYTDEHVEKIMRRAVAASRYWRFSPAACASRACTHCNSGSCGANRVPSGATGCRSCIC